MHAANSTELRDDLTAGFQAGQIIDVCHAAVADWDWSIPVNATVRHYCEET